MEVARAVAVMMGQGPGRGDRLVASPSSALQGAAGAAATLVLGTRVGTLLLLSEPEPGNGKENLLIFIHLKFLCS